MTREPSGADHAHADIGIVTALPIELGAFLTRCQRVNHYKGEFTFRGGRYDDIRIAAVESGIGFVRARRATLALIEAHTPRWVLSCGFAGALRPEMKVGHIAVANSIVDQHGNEQPVPCSIPANPDGGLFVGRLLTADEMVRTVEEKTQLAEKHEAIAVDMESLAVAQIAHEQKVGFMAVRSISDDMSADLPPEILSIIGSSGAVRIGAALGSLVKRPGSYKEMMKLRENAHKAAKSLSTFLDGIVHQLHKAGG